MKLIKRLEAFYEGCDVSRLLIRPASRLSAKLASIVNERYEASGVLEYEMGCAYFASRYWACNEATLVPREDSLILLDLVFNHIALAKPKNCLEVGAGTGILSLSVALGLEDRFDLANLAHPVSIANSKMRLSACDISKEALEIASVNKSACRVDCELICSDFRDLDFKQYDFVFSNPPYIANDYLLDERVKKEPALALFGGELGSEIICELIDKCAFAGVKTLACEIGYDQLEVCNQALAKAGYKAQFAKDLAGFNRAFIAHLKD